ncbi:protein PNS1-like [Tasmannia lanceolata]|uniref:protein PNS1-like n=1 Tax=Tasmannia lanceolata TaxID=3420 RepID=UPI004062DF4C
MDTSRFFVKVHQMAPTQVKETTTPPKTTTKNFSSKLFLYLFSFHLLLTLILVITLTIRGLLTAHHHHKFHPIQWYPPLLTSTACAGLTAFSLQAIARHHPSKTIKTILWLSPSLTCFAAILIFSTGTPSGLATSILTLIFALIQSLYACRVSRRLPYAAQILSLSLSSTQNSPGITTHLLLALHTATIYSSIWVFGISGAAATGTHFATLYVILLLISIAWTMHVIMYTLHVAISHVGFVYFSRGDDTDTRVTFTGSIISSICVGSVLVPVLELFRGLARVMDWAGGDTNEFLFSCAHCYSGIADRLVAYGNRWGLVHVGVYGKGFVRASADTWEMFVRMGMDPLIDSDLTGSFCFLSSVAVGGLCGLVAGSWVFTVDKNHVTAVSVSAFLIGYFMGRIAMTWPQACISAYHVAYAENPQSIRFDSTIPDRIRDLQASQA